MRELPKTNPLLLPTLADILAPAVHRVFAGGLGWVLLGVALLVPAWRFCSNDVPDRAVRIQSQFQDQSTLKSSSAIHPLDETDEIASSR